MRILDWSTNSVKPEFELSRFVIANFNRLSNSHDSEVQGVSEAIIH